MVAERIPNRLPGTSGFPSRMSALEPKAVIHDNPSPIPLCSISPAGEQSTQGMGHDLPQGLSKIDGAIHAHSRHPRRASLLLLFTGASAFHETGEGEAVVVFRDGISFFRS